MAASRSSPAHSRRRQLARLGEAAGGAQLHDPVGVLDAEQLGEDAARVVGVVEEEDEIAQADQRVGAVTRLREVLGCCRVRRSPRGLACAPPYDAGDHAVRKRVTRSDR